MTASPSKFSLVPFAFLLAFPSTGFVQKYSGLPGVAIYLAAVFGVVILISRFGGRLAPPVRKHFRMVAAALFAGLAICFVALHPLEDSRGPGKSSDRDEGLELAVTRLAEARTPYYGPNQVAGPLSVLPGSVILAAPFVGVGQVGYQNLFWLGIFLFCLCRFFKDRMLVLCLLTLPLAVSPAALYEFVSGGDLLANGIFVAVLFLFALQLVSNSYAPGWQRWLACLLLGVGLASRPNFILLAPLFGATLWRMVGLRQAFAATALVVLTATILTVPFYLNDPAGFTPLLARKKLAGADHALPWASTYVIVTTVLVTLVCAWRLFRHHPDEPIPRFFRACTWVTLTPMICAVAILSLVSGRLDFDFMRDRFGLMFVPFAILGWGGRWLRNPANSI